MSVAGAFSPNFIPFNETPSIVSLCTPLCTLCGCIVRKFIKEKLHCITISMATEIKTRHLIQFNVV
jgi:hypothetical protein